MSAQVLFDKLHEAGIIGASGETYFELHGLKTKVRDSSIVGNVIQEWLKLFMENHKIPFRFKPNSQDFPDFLMHASDDDIDLLEVKCFKKSPNFDVANFSAYCRSLLNSPYRLDSDYLIIEYKENDDGSILIKRAWLKKYGRFVLVQSALKSKRNGNKVHLSISAQQLFIVKRQNTSHFNLEKSLF